MNGNWAVLHRVHYWHLPGGDEALNVSVMSVDVPVWSEKIDRPYHQPIGEPSGAKGRLVVTWNAFTG